MRPQGPPVAKPAMKRFIALVDRLPVAKIAPLPPHMSPATIEAWGAAAGSPLQIFDLNRGSPAQRPDRQTRRVCRLPQSPGKSAREPFSIISDYVVRWSLIPDNTRRVGANHRKMVAGGALDSQNRPSPVGQRPTDNPKDCRLCRNVDRAPFFLLRLADRREAGSRGSPEPAGLRRKSFCKARRKKECCDFASMLTYRLCGQLAKSVSIPYLNFCKPIGKPVGMWYNISWY